MAKFFYIPFGIDGDLTAVPDLSQPNGSVSYAEGYGFDYQLPLADGGAALPINRAQFNQLFNDVTGAISNIQQQGVFSWIGPVADAPLSGANFPYPINALVYYIDGNIYQSLIANNQDVPGATANWANVSANSGIPIGTIIDYAGLIVPPNCLPCDGSPVSRTTYASLFTAITSTQNGNTYTSTTVDHLTSTANLQPGFYVSGMGVQAGTTIVSITNSTSLVLSLATTMTLTGTPLVFAPWGIGDGSTTFEVPDLQRSVTAGSGGSVPSGAVFGNVIGNQGGSETFQQTTDTMPSHNHPGSTTTPQSGRRGAVSGSGITATSDNTGSLSLTIAFQGNGQPHTIVQPSTVVFKCIKFQ